MLGKLYNKVWRDGPKRKVATVSVVLMSVAGAALAAWLISSTGAGAGRIGTLTAPTIVAGSPASDILPGGTGDAAVKVTNPNSSDLVITAVTNPGGSDARQCSGGDFSVSVVAHNGLTIPVPAHADNLEIKLPDTYRLSSDASSACAGQTFTRDVGLTFSTQ